MSCIGCNCVNQTLESTVKYAFIEVHTGYVMFLSQEQAEARDPNEIVAVPHLDIPEEKV